MSRFVDIIDSRRLEHVHSPAATNLPIISAEGHDDLKYRHILNSTPDSLRTTNYVIVIFILRHDQCN